MSIASRRPFPLILTSLLLLAPVGAMPGALAQGGGGGSSSTDPAVTVPVPPAPPPAQPDPAPQVQSVTLDAAVIPVGKWPEGLAYDGKHLWVAESGNRRVAKIDPVRRRIVKRSSVGRLPVDMLALSDGRVLSLVHTDKKLWQHSPRRGKGNTLARIGDCPWGLTGDSGAIWVLTYTNCNSAGSKVFEIDPKSGRTRRRFDLPGGAFDIAANQRGVLVIHTHGQNSTLSGIDRSTGEIRSQEIPGVRLHHIHATADRIYTAGAFGAGGVIASLINAVGKVELAEQIGALAAGGAHVVAVGMSGTIYVLSTSKLALLREIKTTRGVFRPQQALIVGERLFITTHNGSGQNGAVLIVDGWRP